ncbi:MAG: amidohydrolase [Clostridia bacterium]|jgi:imidazolonepropionase-like amidohydrolase|nr:amidohydrolase [Clostridia bacterium]
MENKAFIHAKIYTMNGPVLENAALLWKGDKIVAVGGRLDLPADTEILDLQGKTVTPGFIDAHTHIGILEEIYQTEGDDVNEDTDPVTPQLRALDAVNPYDLAFEDAVSGGITTVMTGPGSSNVVAGTSLVMKTAGKDLHKMVLNPAAGLKVAFGENPKRTYYEQKKSPVTRMGIAALLRQAFIDAQVYERKIEKCQKDEEVLERELGLETLLEVLRRKMPLRAHAHRADDIMTALRIAREFECELVIEHGTEAHKVIPELSKAGVPIVLGPTFSNRSKVELAELSWQSAARLQEAGILVALTTDHSVTPVQYLPLCAALAVKYGMEETAALQAITINPARILKLEHRIGSLACGKDADMVVLSGHPLDWRTRVETVYIDGESVYVHL